MTPEETAAAAAAAAATATADKPEDKPADAPAEKSTETTADKPTDKPADAPADKSADAPAPIALTAPKGAITLTEDSLAAIATLATEHKLDAKAAQALVDTIGERINQSAETYFAERLKAYEPDGAEWTKQVEQWESEALKDRDIGGSAEQLQHNAQLAQRVLATFFPKEVVALLHATGWGSHPGVLKGLVKIGRQSTESSLVTIDAPASVKPKLTTAQKLYGPK